MAFQLMYAFIVFTLYITNTKVLTKYLFVWGSLALLAVFTVWKQKYIGLSPEDNAWLHGPGGRQHLIQGGSLIRYWSIYSDAANFGIGIAATAVAFIIFGITSRIKKHKYFFLIVGRINSYESHLIGIFLQQESYNKLMGDRMRQTSS